MVPRKNAPCIVKCSVDGRWYRGQITDICGAELEVHYVDVGNTQRVPRNYVKPIQQKLTQLFPLAHLCYLHGVSIVAWTPDEKTYFENLTKDKRLTATFSKAKCKFQSGHLNYPIILVDHRSDGVRIVINELLKDFRDKLVIPQLIFSFPLLNCISFQ